MLFYKKRFDFLFNIVTYGNEAIIMVFYILIFCRMWMDLNKVMLIWRATNNLQVKTIETTWTPVVNFTVATNRKYTNKEWNTMEDAEYHRCVAYWKGAEVLGKYLVKGKRIYVEGRLRTRKWQDSEWADKFSTEIIVDSFIFLDSKWEWGEDESYWVEGWEPSPEMDEEMPF